MAAAKLTARERAYVLDRWRGSRVRVAHDGGVHVYTSSPRGDGGPVPWWVFAGWIEDVRREVRAPTPADLVAWRKREGLTQTRSADLAGVGLRAWQRWEEGTRRVPHWLRDRLVQRWGSAP